MPARTPPAWTAPPPERRSSGSVQQREKAARILGTLEQLYPAPPIPLEHADPFTLLVAVVLSAQTTDKKVNQVTPRLFELARTPQAMSALPVAQIHATIRQIGLAPQKAKALQALSKQLVERHAARVPRDFAALLELSGVGRKTANVVLSQAFGEPAFAVDTHIHRLAARWGLSRGKTPDHTERDLCRLFPRSHWNRLHLQMIYFGREHCPALYHDLETCPICSWASSKRRRAEERRKNQRSRSARSS